MIVELSRGYHQGRYGALGRLSTLSINLLRLIELRSLETGGQSRIEYAGW